MKLNPPLVLLVGAGNICRSAHVPCLEALKVRVIAVVDPLEEARTFVSEKFSGVGTADSLDKLSLGGVNVAIVSSPTVLHFHQVKFLLAGGIHVLCEKPLGTTGEEATALQKLALRKNLVLQAGYFRRFHEASGEVKKILASGKFGKLENVVMCAGHDYRAGFSPPSIFDKKLAGGGVFIDFGCHLVDRLFDWFTKVKPLSYADDCAGGVEANAHAKFVINNGGAEIPVDMYLSRTNDLGYYSLLTFTKGKIKIGHNNGNDLLLYQDGKEEKRLLCPKRHFSEYFMAQWQEFVQRINGQEEDISSLASAVAVSGLIGRCYKKRKRLRFKWEEDLKEYLL